MECENSAGQDQGRKTRENKRASSLQHGHSSPKGTCLADKGQLRELCGGYTFFWSGRSSTERREECVGFAIKSQLANKLNYQASRGHQRPPYNTSAPTCSKNTATLISDYANTTTNPVDTTEDKFYEELDALISTVPPSQKLIVLGEFKSRVGTVYQTWQGIIGRHGTGKCISNGLLLLKTCARHNLFITNTLFRLPTRKKTSWMHPCSRHRHLIYYLITRKRDRMHVRVTRRGQCVVPTAGLTIFSLSPSSGFPFWQREDPKDGRQQRGLMSPR